MLIPVPLAALVQDFPDFLKKLDVILQKKAASYKKKYQNNPARLQENLDSLQPERIGLAFDFCESIGAIKGSNLMQALKQHAQHAGADFAIPPKAMETGKDEAQRRLPNIGMGCVQVQDGLGRQAGTYSITGQGKPLSFRQALELHLQKLGEIWQGPTVWVQKANPHPHHQEMALLGQVKIKEKEHLVLAEGRERAEIFEVQGKILALAESIHGQDCLDRVQKGFLFRGVKIAPAMVSSQNNHFIMDEVAALGHILGQLQKSGRGVLLGSIQQQKSATSFDLSLPKVYLSPTKNKQASKAGLPQPKKLKP